MEISPMREVRATAAAGTVKAESEVPAALALNGTGRMEDDAYRGNEQAPRRGADDEEPEDVFDLEESEDLKSEPRAARSEVSDTEGNIDCFA